MKQIKYILPHVFIVLSGIFIVFLILDSYNPTMDFVGNSISLKLLWSFCILTIINSIVTLIQNNRKRGTE